MCHFLYIASPLTLSEVRSMVPDGLTADLLPPPDAAVLLQLMPGARTGARFVAGACSCDLFIERKGGIRGEEADLRLGYRALGVSRDGVIRALERHRRTGRVRHGPEKWAALLAAFVAEHARNAGPTLYLRQFSADARVIAPTGSAAQATVAEVREDPRGWLVDDHPTIVTRDR